MRVIIDASIAVDFYTQTPGTEAYKTAYSLMSRIQSGEINAIVPMHFDLEVASGIMKWHRRTKTTTTEQVLIELEKFASVPMDYIQVADDAYTIGKLATMFNSGVYDAVYIQAALELGAPLATCDKAQAECAKRVGVTIWKP